jgi:cytoskeleton protein RodZ
MMSSVPDDQPHAVTASRVGADLRAARERLGWSLPAIAAHLRIRLPFLEAIEDGRISDLPGNAYAVGFVRTYASSLGLAPDEIARRFRAEAADVNRKTELTFPAPVPDRGVPAGAVVLLGVVLAVGAYVGWYRMSGNGHPAADAVQPVPARLAPLAGTFAPKPLPSQPAPSPSPAATSPGAAPTAAGPAPVPQSPAYASAAVPTPMAAPPAPADTPAAPVPPVTPVAATPGQITLRATANAWVQVRDRSGPVLLNRVMRAGETWPVPTDKGQLLLTTGNAGGTELLVDGVAGPALGADGAVRRDLPLDAQMIRDGKLAPATAAPKPAAHQP